LRLADTVGVWTPFEVDRLFRDLLRCHPALSLGFHGHNDLGMATANALAAARAGAEWVDVTVNGLGDRAGNVPLAELAVAVETCLKRPTGIHLDQLAPLSALVATACGEALPMDKPVVGERVFRHEAGIHVHGLLRDRLSYQPFLPESVGRTREHLESGPHSGRTARRFCSSTPARSLS
jgi:homocitrate synthase NifV